MRYELVSDTFRFVGAVGGMSMEPAESRLRGLLIRGLDGEQIAYRDFLKEMSVVLRRYIQRQLTRGGRAEVDAEDIVQEALIAIHEKRHTYERTLPVTAWAHAIARYKMIDILRAGARRRSDVPLTGEEELPSREAEAAVDNLEIRWALGRLPERFKTSIELTKLEGLSVAEAASRTGMSESAIKVNVHRGLKALGRMFGRIERRASDEHR